MRDERARLKIERYRPRLQSELEELLALSERTAEARGPVQLDQQSVGRLSRMDAIQAQQMALASERQRKLQIARIRRAPRRYRKRRVRLVRDLRRRNPGWPTGRRPRRPPLRQLRGRSIGLNAIASSW